jgi:hypothetical protein
MISTYTKDFQGKMTQIYFIFVVVDEMCFLQLVTLLALVGA